MSSQAEFQPAAGRPDPVELLAEQNTTREADLVPVRHGRMMVAEAFKRLNKSIRKARTRDSLNALPKFAELVDGRHRLLSQPPVVVPLRDFVSSFEMTADQAWEAVEEQFRVYKTTLSNERRQLLNRFTIVDVARKVVGVGSVGTRAFIVLLQGRDDGDPLFLQLKEATTSVLEDHLPHSRYATPGQRVVEGQRLTQAASDIFLGWTRGIQADRHYYWRQLRDMKPPRWWRPCRRSP